MTSVSRALVATTMFLVACGPASSADTDDEGSTGAASTSGGTTSGPVATTALDTTGGGPIATSTTGGGSSSSDGGFIPRPDMGGPVDPLPNGEQCERADDCESGACYLFPGAGVGLCSDCETDADCMIDGGPGTCGFDASPWAVCTDGSAGQICMSDEACMGELVCAELFPGNPFTTCGECTTAANCMQTQLCILGDSGGTECIDPGTVENGGFCTGPDDGACMSGHCTSAQFMGMDVGLFLCGECSEDMDCDPGQVCMPAMASQMDAMPSMCG